MTIAMTSVVPVFARSVLSSFLLLHYLIFITALGNRYCYYFHVTDGETKAHGGNVICLRSQSSSLCFSLYYDLALKEGQMDLPPAFHYEKFQAYRKKN